MVRYWSSDFFVRAFWPGDYWRGFGGTTMPPVALTQIAHIVTAPRRFDRTATTKRYDRVTAPRRYDVAIIPQVLP